MGWRDTLNFVVETPRTPTGVEPRTEQPTTGVHYDTDWAQTPAARTVREAAVWGFMKPAVALYAPTRVMGADRLDDIDGPVVFAANHNSHADTTLLLAAIPTKLRRRLVVAAGADYFFPNRVASAASALFIGAFPIERSKLSRMSIQHVLDALGDDKNVLIYPEGSRSPDGFGTEHRPGAAFVARRAGVPIVPIYLHGTGEVLPKGRSWPSRHRTTVVFGRPMSVAEGEDARGFADRIQRRIDELADEFESGWWSARQRAAAGQTPRLTGPETGSWRRRWARDADRRTAEARRRGDVKRWPER